MKKLNFNENTDVLNYNIGFLVEDRVHNRIKENAEDFVRQDGDGYSKRDRFGFSLKRKLNATHFDIFTVLPSSDGQFTDIRFAAHGSPYYAPERMEGIIAT